MEFEVTTPVIKTSHIRGILPTDICENIAKNLLPVLAFLHWLFFTGLRNRHDLQSRLRSGR
jgi:hypothetical protein